MKTKDLLEKEGIDELNRIECTIESEDDKFILHVHDIYKGWGKAKSSSAKFVLLSEEEHAHLLLGAG